MTRLTDRPDRSILTQIIRDEARKGCVCESEVINGIRAPAVTMARYAAIRRVLSETNCTQEGLSRVWGIGIATIRQALAETGEKQAYRSSLSPAKPPPPLYDDNTITRLRWAHGDARTAQIAAGACPRTQADIARWRALGGVPMEAA